MKWAKVEEKEGEEEQRREEGAKKEGKKKVNEESGVLGFNSRFAVEKMGVDIG